MQPITYTAHSPFIKSISLQFRDKNVVGDHIKGLPEVQVGNISSSSHLLMQSLRHKKPLLWSHSQAQFALGEALSEASLLLLQLERGWSWL